MQEPDGVVRVLREALSAMQVAGWASFDAAIDEIAQRHSGQTPATCQFSSWPQVLHESRVFQLEYRLDVGRNAGWYLERPGRR